MFSLLLLYSAFALPIVDVGLPLTEIVDLVRETSAAVHPRTNGHIYTNDMAIQANLDPVALGHAPETFGGPIPAAPKRTPSELVGAGLIVVGVPVGIIIGTRMDGVRDNRAAS